MNTAEYIHAEASELLDIVNTRELKPRLIFADPPFNIGVDYGDTGDNMGEDEYVEWLTEWIGRAAHLLPGDGSLWINVPDRWAANVVTIARDAFELTLYNWCIWHYRFAQHQPNRFLVSKVHALWFSPGTPIVNREAVLVPSLRATAYNDPRADTAGERMDFDVWGFDQYWGRVQGNNAERVQLHPNQLPEKYLERVVKVCTNPGDLVVDPFCGSGTTACVASALGRKVITGDVNKAYLLSAAERRSVRV